MKLRRKEMIKSIFLTIVPTVAIMAVAYAGLVHVGRYYMMQDRGLMRISAGNDSPYVFYSSADDAIESGMWKEYENSEKFRQFYGEDVYASDVFDINELYSNLVYYFYKMIPISVMEKLYETDISLRDRMDYDNIEDVLRVAISNDKVIFYYDETLKLMGENYRMRFCFTQGSVLKSFEIENVDQKEQIDAKEEKEKLTTWLNQGASEYLQTIYFDIVYQERLMDHYTVNEKVMTGKYEPKYEEFFDTDYQIVEMNHELMIIFLDINFTLHYDPIEKVFCGFNISEQR